MYLNYLNDIQQKIFLGLAQRVIEADKKIMHQERELLNQLSNEMNQYEMISKPTPNLLKDYFKEDYAKKILVMELLSLAECDGEIALEEEDLILAYCKELGISKKDYNKIKKFVNKFYKLKSELEEYLFSSEIKENNNSKSN